jgi:hypothetical protein
LPPPSCHPLFFPVVKFEVQISHTSHWPAARPRGTAPLRAKRAGQSKFQGDEMSLPYGLNYNNYMRRAMDEALYGSRPSKPTNPVSAAREQVRQDVHRAEYSASDINRKLDEVEKVVETKTARIKELETALKTVQRLVEHDAEVAALISGALKS